MFTVPPGGDTGFAFKALGLGFVPARAYIEARSLFVGVCGMSFRPRDLANPMARRAGAPDGFVRHVGESVFGKVSPGCPT
jgi:hypothetical protein